MKLGLFLRSVFLFILLNNIDLNAQIQWAQKLVYDSEVSNKDQFNARMILGAPDASKSSSLSPRCATLNKQKSSALWLEYLPQDVSQILILENNACGLLVRAELIDEANSSTVVYEQPANPVDISNRLVVILLPQIVHNVKKVKLKFSGSSKDAQIDAVGLSAEKTPFSLELLAKQFPSISLPNNQLESTYLINYNPGNTNVLNNKKEFEQLLLGLKPGESGNLGGKVNSSVDEIAPIISPDERTIYFIRSQHPKNSYYGWNSDEEIWFSTWNESDSSWNVAQHAGLPFNSSEINKVVGIRPDGNTMLIKGAYKNGKYKGSGFSFSYRIPDGWSSPEQIRLRGYENMSRGNYVGSYFANDGKTLLLSFSEKSDSPYNDLYVSFLGNDGDWSRPMNLGDKINTQFGEDTPFLASDGVSLYFASDRPGGLGKRDIYLTRRLDDSWNNWSVPTNLGSSINTIADDANYSIAASGNYAYLVSERNSIGGSDVVRIKLKDEIKPNPVVLISGKVKDAKTSKFIPASVSYQVFPEGVEAGIASSDPDSGTYKIVLPYGKNYAFSAAAPGYLPISDNLDLSNVAKYTEIHRDLFLVPFEKGETIRLNNVFFESAKSELLPNSFPELNKLVDLLQAHPTMKIAINGHTDNIGKPADNLNLSEKRAASVLAFLISKNIQSDRISSFGFGESKPLTSNDSEENRAINRRVEFSILAP